MTEPTLTREQLDQAMLAATRALVAARLSRDPARIAAAQEDYDYFLAIKYSGV